MFYIPMIFMLIVTLCSLVLTIIAKVKVAGEDPWNIVQAVIAIVLVVLAVDLAITALKTIGKESKA